MTKRVTAQIVVNGQMLNSGLGKTIVGYEIHMGKTSLGKDARPAFRIIKRGDKQVNDFDGAIDDNGLILGTYIHGIFDRLPLRRCLIDFLMKSKGIKSKSRAIRDIRAEWEKSLRQFADIVKNSLDMDKICEITGIPPIKG